MAGPDNKCRVPLLFAFKALLSQKNMLLSDRMLAFLAQFFLKKISRKFCGIEKRHYLCNRNQQNVDSVAQLVEQMTLNHWVESSSLSGVTKQSLKSGCFFISADHRLWRTFQQHLSTTALRRFFLPATSFYNRSSAVVAHATSVTG